MTDTIEAPEVTREPIPVADIHPQDMWEALKWVRKSVTQLVDQIERNSSSVHMTLPSVKELLHHIEDILYPPPLPEAPQDVVPLYAHAVHAHDRVWLMPQVTGLDLGRWFEVWHAEQSGEWVKWSMEDWTGRQERRVVPFRINELFTVQRAERVGEDE